MDRELPFNEVVIKMENRMVSFYRSVADKVSDGKLKDVLGFLASEEETHADLFLDLSPAGLKVEALNKAFETTGGIMAFLSGKILDDDPLARSWETEKDVIRVALDSENDSILFYHALLRFVDDDGVSAEIQKVIESEYGHVSELLKILNMLDLQGSGGERGQESVQP